MDRVISRYSVRGSNQRLSDNISSCVVKSTTRTSVSRADSNTQAKTRIHWIKKDEVRFQLTKNTACAHGDPEFLGPVEVLVNLLKVEHGLDDGVV